MSILLFVLASLAALGSISAAYTEEYIFTILLKRQAPGTPAYNCHDNCGTAITISKSGVDVCMNDIFLTDYQACLQCAGPDNYNIWQYYGNSLKTVASGCGLDTEPISGKQPDPQEALHATSASDTIPSTATTALGAPTSSSEAVASTTPASETSPSSLTYTATASATELSTSSISTLTTFSSNITSTFTSPPQQTVNAAGRRDSKSNMIGAVVLAIAWSL